jgi:hypothetical protein
MQAPNFFAPYMSEQLKKAFSLSWNIQTRNSSEVSGLLESFATPYLEFGEIL